MLLNMTLAYFVRYNHFTWKRTGVYVLHSGLVVLMLSELFTGLAGVEGSMVIDEGRSSNVVIQQRYAELAITSPAEGDPKSLDEIVVPASMLRKPGAVVRDAALPFDVEVVRFMKNSAVRTPNTGEDVVATAGIGQNVVAVERPEVSGTDKTQTIDVPSAYLTFRAKDGQLIGTYLMSVHLGDAQVVKVGDRKYEVDLRQKRTYRPYSIHLIRFRFDRYEGTGTARNYSSLVRVDDPDQRSDREVLIKMNDPLRYRGETFYQQDFNHDTERGTVLQVVRNPAWTLPYIACALVALGMLIHFGMHLLTFLARRRAA
jgi:cytochrome c biogenesis protein ResB